MIVGSRLGFERLCTLRRATAEDEYAGGGMGGVYSHGQGIDACFDVGYKRFVFAWLTGGGV